MSTKWTLTLLLLSWTASQINSNHIRASFGEACGPDARCDTRKALSCNINNTCSCIKPEEMIYDKDRGKCVAMAGERCTHSTVVNNATPQGKRWTEKLDCVHKSRCHDDGYCRCEPHYYETPGGYCSHKLAPGGNCTNHSQCRTDMNFFCRMGVCSCDTSEAVLDPELKKCVGIAGTECSKYEGRCVPNAKCPLDKSHHYFDFNRGRYYLARSSPRKCECLQDYIKSKDGLCLAKYDMTCGEEGVDGDHAPCHEDFACINGKCTCPFPQHQLHDNSHDLCISLVGGPCKERVSGSGDHFHEFPCVDNAHCNGSPGGIMECQCDPGYIESPVKKCEIEYGGHCSPGGTPCDSAADLICRDGICSCQDFEVYDQVGRKCRGLVGAQCATQDNTGRYCVDGAVCHAPRLSRFRPSSLDWLGTCRCNDKSATKLDRTCGVTSVGSLTVAKVPQPQPQPNYQIKLQPRGKSGTEDHTFDPNLAGVSSLSTAAYDSEEDF